MGPNKGVEIRATGKDKILWSGKVIFSAWQHAGIQFAILCCLVFVLYRTFSSQEIFWDCLEMK